MNYKLPQHYKLLAVAAMLLLNAEASFIEFKECCPFKLEKIYISVPKQCRKSYHLILLLTGL
jgi:hypothetical protein